MIAIDSGTVKAALRRRHPAVAQGSMTGQWTCIEEWANVDLIALNAWQDADVIGYEVKVSRSDYRAELRQPLKRVEAVAMCTEFYFAVPQGLLKPDEIAYDEPDWEPEDWERSRCPGIPTFGPAEEYVTRLHEPADLLDTPPGRYGGQCDGAGWTGTSKAGRKRKGPFTMRLPVPFAVGEFPSYVERVYDYAIRQHGSEDAARAEARRSYVEHEIRHAEANILCPTCGGKGYLAKSRVEIEAPTLWVPRDVGLIEVRANGTHIVRKSPKRPSALGLLPWLPENGQVWRARQKLHQLIRWTSNRPDPRHATPVRALERAA